MQAVQASARGLEEQVPQEERAPGRVRGVRRHVATATGRPLPRHHDLQGVGLLPVQPTEATVVGRRTTRDGPRTALPRMQSPAGGTL